MMPQCVSVLRAVTSVSVMTWMFVCVQSAERYSGVIHSCQQWQRYTGIS